MPIRLLVVATGFVMAWGAGAWAQETPADGGRPAVDFVALHRTHIRHARLWHPLRGAYHIPRFSQAEAEAEVHTQYRYRTPYLPYWVFP